MYFNLKQSGDKVKSTRGSSASLKANVIGNRLKGLYSGAIDFNFKITEDYKSFKGKAWPPSGWSIGNTLYLKGERQK